jgi:hypothetical protein
MVSGAAGPWTAATMPSKFTTYGWSQTPWRAAAPAGCREGLDEDAESWPVDWSECMSWPLWFGRTIASTKRSAGGWAARNRMRMGIRSVDLANEQGGESLGEAQQ